MELVVPDALARDRRHGRRCGSGRQRCPAGSVRTRSTRSSPATASARSTARGSCWSPTIAIAERAATSPLPPGAFEADPAASAPGTVAAAAEALGVPPEAARLFLQLLALPAPTKAAVQRWNGWDGKAWTAASQALVDAGHVVTGQRSRAGRDVFLTGAWVELSAPDLPVETWKLPLYGATPAADGTVTTPLDRLLPRVPLHRLFEQAWTRWSSGDRPGFVEPPGRRRA